LLLVFFGLYLSILKDSKKLCIIDLSNRNFNKLMSNMKKVTTQSILVFIVLSIIAWCLSLFTSMALYDATLTSGKDIEQVVEQSISLNYWINDQAYLNTLGEPMDISLDISGWFVVIIFNIGMPALIAASYRLKKIKREAEANL
jgi:hypothetical protein